MPRKCTEFGKSFREKFNYTGKLTKERMGPELWNEYNKILSKNRMSSFEHKQDVINKRIIRNNITKEKVKLRRLDGNQYKKYCKTPELIEGFYEAQKDNFENWILHHKLEQMFTADELKAMNIYYDCKPGELMFIKASEHNGNTKLHYGLRIRDKSKSGRPKKI